MRGKRSRLLPLAAAVNRRLDGRFAEIGVLLLAALFFLADGAVLAAVAAMRLAAGEAIARAGQLTEAALPLGLALFFLYLGAVLLWQLRREKAQDGE